MEYTIDRLENGDAIIKWRTNGKEYMMFCDWEVREKYIKRYGLTKEVKELKNE